MNLNKLQLRSVTGRMFVRDGGTSLCISLPQAGRETEALSVFQKMFKLNNRYATKPFPVCTTSLMFAFNSRPTFPLIHKGNYYYGLSVDKTEFLSTGSRSHDKIQR